MVLAALAAVSMQIATVRAENAPGVSATEIKMGQTMPYSGPLSAYAVIGKAELAYFQMINDAGGVNGRKLSLESRDDAFNPAKTVEQTRKLVEEDGVAFIFGALGTPTNAATRGYLNDHQIPQLFLATGADQFGDPAHFPWTMHFNPSYRTEGQIYAKYILREKPEAKVGILYQHDDFGRDYLRGMKDGFGDSYGKRVVHEESYETTDPTVDAQVIALQGSGADVFLIAATARAAAQAIRKAYDVGWRPLRLLNLNSTSIAAVLQPAGLDKAAGILVAGAYKDATNPQWAGDADVVAWDKYMDKYLPGADKADGSYFYGYSVAQAMVQVLKQCGDDLSRDNIMKQAANLREFHAAILLPGITMNTSATNYHPIRQMQLGRFDGKAWQNFGGIIAAQ